MKRLKAQIKRAVWILIFCFIMIISDYFLLPYFINVQSILHFFVFFFFTCFFSFFFSLVCILLVVVVVVVFFPTYFFFTDYIQEAGEGTSPILSFINMYKNSTESDT